MLSASSLDLSENLRQHNQSIKSGSSVSKHVTSFFNPSGTLMFVPTGVIATGYQQLESVLGVYSRQAYMIQTEKVLSQILNANQIVQESVMVISHLETLEWLLPGVRATKKEILVSLVTILSFDETGKILAKRVYWDQASVLKQIGVLPKSLYCKANSSEVTLPVAGRSDCEALVHQVLNEMDAQLDKMNLQSEQSQQHNRDHVSESDNQSTSVYQQEHVEGSNPVGTRSSTRVLARPGGNTSDIFGYDNSASNTQQNMKSSSSDIFSEESNSSNRPTTRVLSRPGGKSSDIFGTETQRSHTTGLNRRDPNQSSLSMVEDSYRPSQRQFSSKSNRSQISFESDEKADPFHSGKRIDPTSNHSSINFANDQVSIKLNTNGRRDPNARSEEADYKPNRRGYNISKSSITF